MVSLKYQESRKCRSIKPPLLKDYLLDDLSSCSSNGFKSNPRRQCCTTVRFLVDNDLKSKPPSPIHSSSKTRQPAISVFQKTSEAVLNAVKLLSTHNRGSLKSAFLGRSFSKVFKRTFWKKRNLDGQIQDGEIHRWNTFHNLIAQFPETPPYCIATTTTTTPISATATATHKTITVVPTTTNTTTTTTTTDSSGVGDNSSWSENEFTSSEARSGASSADTDEKEKNWVAKDEKEQFSPVSVLESPFHDKDGDDGSPTDSDSKHVQSKGMKKKRAMKRHGRVKTLTKMEPINMDHRLAALSVPKMGSNENIDTIILDAAKAQKMLDYVKSRTHLELETNSRFCADNVLLDFFMDSLSDESDDGLIEKAVSYLAGKEKEMGFDWKVEASRKGYIKDMEKGGSWKHVEDLRTDLVKEIEGGIWSSMVNDLMNELKVK